MKKYIPNLLHHVITYSHIYINKKYYVYDCVYDFGLTMLNIWRAYFFFGIA